MPQPQLRPYAGFNLRLPNTQPEAMEDVPGRWDRWPSVECFDLKLSFALEQRCPGLLVSHTFQIREPELIVNDTTRTAELGKVRAELLDPGGIFETVRQQVWREGRWLTPLDESVGPMSRTRRKGATPLRRH